MLENNGVGKKKAALTNNLLINFNNTTPLFKDEYNPSRIISGIGNPKVTTANAKFGRGSGLFAQESLRLVDPVTLLGDFTASGWVRLTAYPSSGYHLPLISTNTTSSFEPIGIISGGGSSTYISRWATDADGALLLFGTAIPLNTWHHLETCRLGTTYRNFFNGKQTHTWTGAKFPAVISGLFNNMTNVGGRLTGNADDLRILDGVCEHNADFTPPTSPYTI